MSWNSPKVNWAPTDYFQLEDWNRIVDNAQYLYDFLNATFAWKDCVLKDTAALPYYDIVNNLEQNLYSLSQTPGFVIVEFTATTWQPRTSTLYTHNPSYQDFNRWEKFEYDLKYWNERMYTQLNGLYAGNFTAGNNRLRQYFARRNF